jgi:hypothetical protein
MTDQEITAIYAQYWQEQHSQAERNFTWFKSRIKQVGCKSVAEFVRVNKIPVTAGTVSNYFRGYNMPLYMVKHLCYGLRVTPNDFLTIMGFYDPEQQKIQALSNEESK